MTKMSDLVGYAFQPEEKQQALLKRRKEILSRVTSKDFCATHTRRDRLVSDSPTCQKFEGTLTGEWEPEEVAIHISKHFLPFGATVYISDSGTFFCTIYID